MSVKILRGPGHGYTKNCCSMAVFRFLKTFCLPTRRVHQFWLTDRLEEQVYKPCAVIESLALYVTDSHGAQLNVSKENDLRRCDTSSHCPKSSPWKEFCHTVNIVIWTIYSSCMTMCQRGHRPSTHKQNKHSERLNHNTWY